MRVSARLFKRILSCSSIAVLVIAGVAIHKARSQTTGRPTIKTEEDFRRAMKELSNWGRWGANDELGAANLITPAKRRRAAALVKDGITVSLEHPIFQE